MKWLLLLVALAAALIIEKSYAVAEPSSGGPVIKTIGACVLPQPSESAAMAFLSYSEGAAVSPIRLGEGKQGDTTSFVEVKIRRGVGPLYVVLAGGRHSIVRFTGWTGRIEKLIVVTHPNWPVAVAGLPADRVQFVHRDSCGPRIDRLYDRLRQDDIDFVSMIVKRPHPESMSDEERLKQKTVYRMPEAVWGAYQPETLAVSQFGIGATEYRPHEFGDVPSWFRPADAQRFHPAGLAEVGLDELVTPVPAAPYKVLPDRAGIGQLIRDGKMERIGSDRFRILAPLELPEGLAGSMQVTFEVASGVPHPTGDPGHSQFR